MTKNDIIQANWRVLNRLLTVIQLLFNECLMVIWGPHNGFRAVGGWGYGALIES